MLLAEYAQFGLREAVHLVVVGIPNIEQCQEVGLFMDEALLHFVGFFGEFGGALAGVLNGEA